jgi:hypothetical protein
VKLESWHPADVKGRWKLVRTDTYKDVPGHIVAADEATGVAVLTIDRETRAFSFGPRGFRIVGRGQR